MNWEDWYILGKYKLFNVLMQSIYKIQMLVCINLITFQRTLHSLKFEGNFLSTYVYDSILNQRKISYASPVLLSLI